MSFLKTDNTFLRFIFVGIINTIIGIALMFILYNFAKIGYWLSSGISYFLASIISFFLNKYFTFSVKNWSVFMIAAFAVNIAVSYFIAYGLVKPIMNYILQDYSQVVRENFALFVGMCLFVIINYFGQRLVVFAKK